MYISVATLLHLYEQTWIECEWSRAGIRRGGHARTSAAKMGRRGPLHIWWAAGKSAAKCVFVQNVHWKCWKRGENGVIWGFKCCKNRYYLTIVISKSIIFERKVMICNYVSLPKILKSKPLNNCTHRQDVYWYVSNRFLFFVLGWYFFCFVLIFFESYNWWCVSNLFLIIDWWYAVHSLWMCFESIVFPFSFAFDCVCLRWDIDSSCTKRSCKKQPFLSPRVLSLWLLTF